MYLSHKKFDHGLPNKRKSHASLDFKIVKYELFFLLNTAFLVDRFNEFKRAFSRVSS